MTTVLFTSNGVWQCPNNVYYVDVKLRGGGGGGGAGGNIHHYTCNGGRAGTLTQQLVAVTPGNYYNIVIGDGGGLKNYDSIGNIGGDTTGFGYIGNGGAGGGQVQFGDPNGGAGGEPLGGGAGSATIYGTGGAASGGGGAAGSAHYDILTGTYSTANSAAGGKGAASIEYTLPTIDFTGNPSSGLYPLTVTWTNNTSNGGSYYWDFGNSTNSNLKNPVPTIYTPGLYTVTLTVTNTYGYSQLVKTDYITSCMRPFSRSFLITSDNLRGV